MEAHDQAVLEAIGPLSAAGFACHWLHSKSKRPIGGEWQNAHVATLDDLRQSHSRGNNLGVRLGEPSALAMGGYLHAFDLDIRLPDLADEAWAEFEELFPDVYIDALPAVISGSGGESRHLYFITDKPFRSKLLATSDGKHRGPDGKWHFDFEIELFGTGKQVVLPPSIHPGTGQPYTWERPFDFDMLAFGAGPFIPSASIEACGAIDPATFAYEEREPLSFEPGQLEADLDLIPISELHYDDWIRLGQALHHQFGGSQEGFDLWLQHTKRSKKYTGERQDREMRRSKWRSFGKYRGQPVTMGTIRTWALDIRRAETIAGFHDAFDEEDGPEFELAGEVSPTNSANAATGSLLLDPLQPGAAEDWTTSLRPPLPPSISDLLGDPDVGVDDIDAIGTAPGSPAADTDWMRLLDIDADKGAVRTTLHNVELIVKNDPRLIGLAQINEFTQETVQRTPPGKKAPRRRNAAKETRQLTGRIWDVKDPLNGDLWSDDRDGAIRSILEAPKTQGGYGIKVTDRDLRQAVVLAANGSPFHPVREYLGSLTWDREQRAERLFIDYLGASDTAYSRQIARSMLIGAVARIHEPGSKFDFAVILEGLQGKRKSTFIRILGRSWFAELDGDFHDARQMVELMKGAWILEIPELSSFSRADVRTIKAFISRQFDRARLAYAHRAGEYPRQCIFIGSTNDRQYLKDDTGGRRWWPVLCSVEAIDTDRLEREIDRIWAEAVFLYREMRSAQPRGTLPLHLSDEAHHQALLIQEDRREETASDAFAGQIEEWLNRPVNNGGLDDGDSTKIRDRVCLKQIFIECLGRDQREYTDLIARSLGRTMSRMPGWHLEGVWRFPAPFGSQKAYWRGGKSPLEQMVALARSPAI